MPANSRHSVAIRWDMVGIVAGLVTMALSWGLTLAQGEASSPQVWLARMAEAMRQRDYAGTFVYLRGDDIETLRVVHRGGDRDELERLFSLTGEVREVIRGADLLTCIRSAAHAIYIEPRHDRPTLLFPMPVKTATDLPYYRQRLGERRRIADHFCQIVELVPQDVYRYGYRLCIATEYHLLLMSEMRTHDGRLIEKVQFTELELPPHIDDRWLESTLKRDGFTVYRVTPNAALANMQPDAGWRVRVLPPGFGLQSNSKRMLSGSAAPVQHMIFSDGLASVSVFISAHDHPDRRAESSHAGTVNAYTTTVAGHSVVALGEVPAVTVEMIGAGVYYAAIMPQDNHD